MAWQAADIDDPDEAARVRAAMMAAACIKQLALRTHVRNLGRFEQHLVEKPVDMMDGADLTALNRMAWAYRRQLPAGVRAGLSISMHDPVARETSERSLTDG